MAVSLISKICCAGIFSYKYAEIIFQILDTQVRSGAIEALQIQIRSVDLIPNIGRLVGTLLCKYKLFFSAKICNPLNRYIQNLQIPRIHLQLFGVKMII
jgi:hypothetical protein